MAQGRHRSDETMARATNVFTYRRVRTTPDDAYCQPVRTRMDHLLRDLRYLLRSLRSSPGFSAVVVLTIAVAVGATTALFSVVDPLLLRAEPFADPNR